MVAGVAVIARVALVAVALAACSAGSEAATSSTPTTAAATTVPASTAPATTVRPTTTTEAVTTTTMSELEAAQVAYYTFTGVANQAMVEVWAPYPDGVPWSEAPALCAVLAPVRERLAQELAGYGAWPVEAQDEIDAQVAGLAADAGVYYQCAKAAGTREAQEPVWALFDDEGLLARSSATRLALGLPIDRG